MISNVNRILLRRSGTLKALANALSRFTGCSPLPDHFDCAAGSFDLVPCACAAGVCPHRHGPGDISLSEYLDELVALAEHPSAPQLLGAEHAPIERIDDREVYRAVCLAIGWLEALELGHAAEDRHLAALEKQGDLAARPRSLGAPTRGLALAGALAATLAGAGAVSARRWLQLVRLHSSYSSIRTRWPTARTMPLISGRSACTTEWPTRFSPRARIVPRCLAPLSSAERTWVTFSFPIFSLSSLS